jgi:VWFA-related protein
MRIASIVALAVVTAARVIAQTSDTAFHVSVNLVQIDAVVTDSKGQHVTGLKREDFQVFEDGKPQKITNFSWIDVSAPKPAAFAVSLPGSQPVQRQDFHRSFVLMIDDSGANAEQDVLPIVDAARKFVGEQIQPTDLVAVTASRGGMGFYQQFTNDRRQLEAAIDKISHRPGFGQWTVDPPEKRDEDTNLMVPIPLAAGEPPYGYRGGSEPNPVGRLVWAIQNLQDAPGRKALILLSHSFNAPPAVIELANRAGVVIYVIDPHGTNLTVQPRVVVPPGGGRKMIDINVQSPVITSLDPYRLLAQQTGGLWIKSAPGADLVADLGRALSDMNDYYLIGYRPLRGEVEISGGKPLHHDLRVKVKPAGLTVRARNGFMGIPNADKPRPGTIDADLQAALLSPFDDGKLHVHVDSTYVASEPDPKTALRSPILRTMLIVNGSDLDAAGGTDIQRKFDFDALIAIFNEDGTPAAQGRRTFHIDITPENAARITGSGLEVMMDVKLRRPGPYQVRAALRDAASGAVGSSYAFVAVPDYNKQQIVLSSIEVTPSQRIAPGQKVHFECQILGIKTAQQLTKPHVEMEIRLFRQGESAPAYDSQVLAVPPSTLAHNLLVGQVSIGTKLEPGEYALQLVAYDRLAPRNRQMATQWTRLSVVKSVTSDH